MTNEATVRHYFTCLDTENWPLMRTLWLDEGEMRAVGARPQVGVDQVIAYFSRLFTPWPTHTDAPTRLIVAGDTIVAEVTFTGTTSDGRSASFDAVDVFDLVEGRIRRLTNWYDIAYARRVLRPDATPA